MLPGVNFYNWRSVKKSVESALMLGESSHGK